MVNKDISKEFQVNKLIVEDKDVVKEIELNKIKINNLLSYISVINKHVDDLEKNLIAASRFTAIAFLIMLILICALFKII